MIDFEQDSRSPDGPGGPLHRVSAVVVSYWTGPSFRECLGALLGQEGLLEVIVVDNGNDAATRMWLGDLAAADARIRLLSPGRNIGFAAGCNLGVSAARGEYLAFVNPDLVTPPGTLTTVLRCLAANPGAWLAGGRLLNMDGSEQRGGRREILTPWRAFIELTRINRLFPNHPYFRRLHLYEDEGVHEVVEVPTVSGAFMMISKTHYGAVGGMDDNLFLHFDDVDLCISIIKAGGRVLYCGNAPVYHYLSTSDVPQAFVEWHKARSASYYFHKHFLATYPAWVVTLISALLWLRFALISVGTLPSDLRTMFRRRRGRLAGNVTAK
ncbi:glycosyl transferase family protein [Paramagnetospirillum magnetotacticum MS-1]|uniref:Glycosyl transferase family protein n=1 Tax=Paramagnetospirillum magnetotacticum MS-1 TaxID=272627 RepID=A0A0C2YIP4_PARME|nr:glycosyltransferase family 2 protein [Paramagnetospirillum magnetotacticum]KIL99589.1 glycosyl transferase family protein [Paramagnetospirillum magnetotacticum MS-1]